MQVDLASGAGLQQAVAALGGVLAVVNCAAVSQPGVCEKSPEAARYRIFEDSPHHPSSCPATASVGQPCPACLKA